MDGGPNQWSDDGGHTVACIRGTDAADCGTPLAPPPLTGTIESTIETYDDGYGHELSRVGRTSEGSLGFGSPVFSVTSGPCTVSDGGRCVGRAEGYGPSEACAISVGGTGGGVLAPCAVFDLDSRNTAHGDYVTLPGGEQFGGSDCPVDAGLAVGDALSWTSNAVFQGGQTSQGGNGCAAKGTCGPPYSENGLGGGWQLCFA